MHIDSARVVQWQNASMVRKKSRVQFPPLAQRENIISGMIVRMVSANRRIRCEGKEYGCKAKKKVYAKFQCASWKEINYFLHKSKKAMEEKLELKKFCNSCRAHKKHKEAKR